MNDYETMKEWLANPGEAIPQDQLTEDDVWAAYIANDVVKHHALTKRPERWSMWDYNVALEAEISSRKDALATLRRGIQVLQTYWLHEGGRVPTWRTPPVHKHAVITRAAGAGYTAMQEYHRYLQLIPRHIEDEPEVKAELA